MKVYSNQSQQGGASMANKRLDFRRKALDSLRSLGRGGDTEIRNIDGRPAHVNLMEARLLDREGSAGEGIVKDIGAGTINPITGLKEYDPQLGYHYHPPSGNINTGNYGDIFDNPPSGDEIDPTQKSIWWNKTAPGGGGGGGGGGKSLPGGGTSAFIGGTGLNLNNNFNLNFGDDDTFYTGLMDWNLSGNNTGLVSDEDADLGNYNLNIPGTNTPLPDTENNNLITEDNFNLNILDEPNTEIDTDLHRNDPNIGPEWKDTIMSHMSTNQPYDALLDSNKDGTINVLDITKAVSEDQISKVGDFEQDPFTFTYTDDIRDAEHFDPTSPEYQQYVQETGGYDELITRFLDDPDSEYAKYFQKFDPTQLEYMKETRDLDIDKFNLKQESYTKQLEAARTDYGLGMRTTGLRTGQSLFDINRQVEGQMGKGGGFSSSGISAGIGRKATRGVFQDYKIQQQALGQGLGSAKTAFELGSEEVALGKVGTQLTYGKSLADFWKSDEEKFYDRLMEVETLKGGG